MKYAAFKYSLKVWLSSVLVAPLIYLLFSELYKGQQPYFGEVTWSMENYLTFILVEILFSLPTWAIFWFLVIAAKRCFLKTSQIKFALFLTGIFLTVGTFFVFMGPVDFFEAPSDFFCLMWANGACISAGVWFYRLVATPIEPKIESQS